MEITIYERKLAPMDMYVRKPVHFHSLFDHAGDLVLVFLLSTGRSSESSYQLEPLKLVTVYNLGSALFRNIPGKGVG